MMLYTETNEHRDHESLIGLSVFEISFLTYLFTTSPTVYAGDSGEFIASAFCLGNAHNSGYPLYALIGKIFALIPVGNVALRLNVMSAFFASLTVWLTYRIIIKSTGSKVAAFSASLLLAFSVNLWSQACCAEVYTFHAFFVALIITLLCWWHETISRDRLLVFAFIVGLSFGNHLQIIMLAPAVFTFIILSDRRTVLNVRDILLLTFFFVVGLSVYIYLPIRTHAGAAIHWGDPDTLWRFINHVSASAHRHAYVFGRPWATYGTRFLGAVREMYLQFNIFWIFAAVGWISEKGLKWKIFWALIILFDLVYTIFLNIISLEITPFEIPTSIVVAILIGKGMANILKYQFACEPLNRIWILCLKPGFLLLPVLLLSMNLYRNDQHTNYTAYEYGINILRSASGGATLIIAGDNILFPITYLRLVENARPDLQIYDRHNLFFKMPFLYKGGHAFFGKWEELRYIIEEELVRTRKNVYMALFNDRVALDRGFDLIPHGLTCRAVTPERFEAALQEETNPWPYYVAESMNGSFYRDYMNRSVTCYFFFKMGREMVFMGQKSLGIGLLRKASSIGTNDKVLHRDLAVLYTDMKMYKEALAELRIYSRNATDVGMLYDTWGYYYAKIGDIDKAIEAFKKSIAANPKEFGTYNNLGLMYLEIGRRSEAKEAFKKSLSLNPKQKKLIRFMTTRGLQ